MHSRLAAAWTIGLATFVVLASGIPGTAQQAPAGASPTRYTGRAGRWTWCSSCAGQHTGSGPWDLGTGRGRLHVTLYAKDLDHPWGVAFLPDPSTSLGAGGLTMLVTERPGRLRAIRNGVLDPAPIGPLPAMLARGLGGILDVALHPKFAENHLIYLDYSKPGLEGENNATTAVYRARWDGGSTLADGKDIFVADAYHGGPGTDQSVGPGIRQLRLPARVRQDGPALRLARRSQHPAMAQDPGSHIGKILRLTDDGSVPPDNPFVGKAGYLPEIYTLGHRNPLGLAFNPIRRQAVVHRRGSAGRRRAEPDQGG